MKCICGYDDGRDRYSTDEYTGDLPKEFIKIVGGETEPYRSTPRNNIPNSDDHEAVVIGTHVAMYACPDCGTVKIKEGS